LGAKNERATSLALRDAVIHATSRLRTILEHEVDKSKLV